jgi:molybdate transport system substrate-binding protein
MRFLVALAVISCSSLAAAAGPLIAVAANLSKPMETLAANFARDSGMRIRLTIGSSGDLLRQIRQGAPYEIYIAAAASYTERAQAEHLTDGGPKVLALANLGAFIPAGSSLDAATDLTALGRMLAAGKYQRIAMANPEVAPFGVAAQQALEKMGVWTVEQDRVLLGENVAQAVQFTLAGGVDVGFIPESYALLPEVASHGRYLPIPSTLHDPLAQTMVLLRGAGSEARTFFLFLQSPATREVLLRSGYDATAP